MVNTSGKERTRKEWEELFKAAGYRDYKITPILGLRSLIEHLVYFSFSSCVDRGQKLLVSPNDNLSSVFFNHRSRVCCQELKLTSFALSRNVSEKKSKCVVLASGAIMRKA
ncbi:hypothetical protein POM88_014563 [Heracleum sosnowskyi]|uniref:Uncharacterized protein n=1 Tax=Heracleum sosnowskyi TaxID=360622 RepID=A0AAD8N4A1_9APIA|nr:hypothetical protein POM88_014563 [Heracleum sosnowskyi]